MIKHTITPVFVRAVLASLLLVLPGLVAAQTCNPYIPLTKPDSRYTHNAAGDEVTDTVTGLIWKRCYEGMIYSGGTCVGAASSFTWHGALAHAASVAQTTGVAWRLPNLKELTSLVEWSCAPAINQTAFKDMSSIYAWSSSFNTSYSGSEAWEVNLGSGHGDWSKTNYTNAVLLVRGQ